MHSRWKNVATHDRHMPRRTAWRDLGPKKGGGGKANWGREVDFYDSEIPVNEPFEDPALGANTVDHSKIRVWTAHDESIHYCVGGLALVLCIPVGDCRSRRITPDLQQE